MDTLIDLNFVENETVPREPLERNVLQTTLIVPEPTNILPVEIKVLDDDFLDSSVLRVKLDEANKRIKELEEKLATLLQSEKNPEDEIEDRLEDEIEEDSGVEEDSLSKSDEEPISNDIVSEHYILSSENVECEEYPFIIEPGYLANKEEVIKRMKKLGLEVNPEKHKYELVADLIGGIPGKNFYYLLRDLIDFPDYYLWWSEKHNSCDINACYVDFFNEVLDQLYEEASELVDQEGNLDSLTGYELYYHIKLEELDSLSFGNVMCIYTLDQYISASWFDLCRTKKGGYNKFVKERMPILKLRNPGMKFDEMAKKVGMEWKRLKEGEIHL